MTDTAPFIEERLRAMYAAQTPGRRVRMATGMFGMAKRLIIAGLEHAQHAETEEAVRYGILERLYGAELSPELRRRIAARSV